MIRRRLTKIEINRNITTNVCDNKNQQNKHNK